MLFVIALFCLVGAVVVAGSEVLGARRDLAASLARAAGDSTQRDARASADVRRRLPLTDPAARLMLRISRRTSLDEVASRLAAAGWTRRFTPNRWLALRAASLASAAVTGLVVGASAGSPAGAVSLTLLFGLAGAALPNRLLGRRIRSRAETICSDLPNALDLLAVSVEAGLGLDAAIGKVVETATGPLSEEFALTLAEMRMGETRAEAFHRLGARSGVPELVAFTRAVVRADELGISLAQSLRVQSTEARLRRQAAAEERAGKAPVKMLFPTIFFIFPALFVVVLGPTALSLSKFLH